MNPIRLLNGLPFVDIDLTHDGKQIGLHNVLLDTGSAATLLHIEHALELGLDYQPSDQLRRVCGVGGAEFVFVKQISRIALGKMACDNFNIQIGDMDYGFSFDGILGMDFLTRVGAQLDFGSLQIQSS